MARLIGPHAAARSFDAELSDPALAHLFGPGPLPTVAGPARGWAPIAALVPRGGPWALPRQLLAEDETLVHLEDGGLFQIREVPDGADFEIFVEEDEAECPGIGGRVAENLDHFKAEFEADLAVFEGIAETTKGGPVPPSRPRVPSNLVGAAGLEPATPAV